MKCGMCGAANATVHLTQVGEGKVRTLHLCEACAQKNGINIDNPASLSDLFFGLGLAASSEESAESPTSPSTGPRACPTCGSTLIDFKNTGRLGCPHCYTAFASELKDLIRQMHRGDRHVGRRPSLRPAPTGAEHAPTGASEDIAQLRAQLERAVAEERYEDAARLRDRIAALRGDESARGRTKETS